MTQFTVACIGIVEKEDKILLVKEGKAEGKWAFPGGRLEKSEKLGECVEREIKEETGLEIETEEIIGTYVMKGDNSRKMFVYTFQCKTRDKKADCPKEDSVQEAKFVEKENIDNLNLRFEQMKEILKDSQKTNTKPQLKYI